MQVCAINGGFWDTKAYNGHQQFKFRSKMDYASNNIINTANTSLICFDSQEYIIGDGADKYTLEYNKTNNILNKLCTYYSLTKFVPEGRDREEYKIVVALPLNVYTSLKSQFEAYLKTKDYIAFTIDGCKKYIHVVDCKTFPEGPAALYANNPQQYKSGIVGILDIGSLTINGCIMSNLNMVRESIFTINSGLIILFNKLKKELNNKFLLNLRDYEMPGIIKNGLKLGGQTKEIRNIIDLVITEHIQEVILEMRKNNWPVESCQLLLTGGGSMLLEKYLEELLPGSFMSNDPVYDTVKGLYSIAGVVYR